MVGISHKGLIGLDVPQAVVDVARRSHLAHRPLGHEGDGPPESRGDLLHAVLEHQVTVGGLEGATVGDVDLVLAEPRLPFGELHRDPRLQHVIADGPDDIFLTRRLQQLVVLNGV